MIRCREMIELFKNAEELDATFVIRYEGWNFGECDIDDFKPEGYDNPEVIQELGYHELVRWEVITMNLDHPEDLDPPRDTIFLIVLVIKKESPIEDPGPANPPTRNDVIKHFDLIQTLEDSDAVMVNLNSIDNTGNYVKSIELIRKEEGEFIDPETNLPETGVTLEIRITNCSTGIIFDWDGFKKILGIE